MSIKAFRGSAARLQEAAAHKASARGLVAAIDFQNDIARDALHVLLAEVRKLEPHVHASDMIHIESMVEGAIESIDGVPKALQRLRVDYPA